MIEILERKRKSLVPEQEIIDDIQQSVNTLMEFEKNAQKNDYGDWHSRFLEHTDRLLDRDGKIKEENLQNFRGLQIFVTDRPSARLRKFYHPSRQWYNLKKIMNLFLGTQRGGIREALDAFDVLEKEGRLSFLKKYPNPDIGNPLQICHKGYTFTNRYIRHIYLFDLFQEKLKSCLQDNFITMDIGSSYGIFSTLIKQEYPQTHHVLVDLPGQLILAHYYLAKLFPHARIAGAKEIIQEKKIDRAFIEQYDFVLLPTTMFHLVQENSVDLITNFASLSEMTRQWFEIYVNSGVFQTAEFLYIVNRYDSYPTYANNITILDYPFHDYEAIYMRTCPFLLYYYVAQWLVGYRQVTYPSQFFQFIGKRSLGGPIHV
ncbi:MAG: putative sugar O-methyltransferase [Candidatus Omnitrophica bacterium]|nr:putative sugar O-methyltransferase [Candidatus Omnitrophota bacterium]